MSDKKPQVEIEVKSEFVPEQSSVENHRFLWAYDISILNNTDEIIQLLNRVWLVTDMRGKVEEVKGPGVIGLQPIIKPGKTFAYSSYCQLSTPRGSMEGQFEMQNLDEIRFLVDIPKFVLVCPATTAFRAHLH